MKYSEPTKPLFEASSLFKYFDQARSFLLKKTLRIKFLQMLFATRAYRLLVFFMLSALFNLILSLKAPLWALLLGPLLLGIPHLLSTIRYIPKLTTLDQILTPQKLYYTIGTIFIVIAVIRLFAFNIIETVPNALEILGCLFVFAGISFFVKQQSQRSAITLLILTSLAFGSLKYPFETLGFLVLIHNFVGFFFWLGRASSKKDRATAMISLFIFSFLSLGILIGLFDFLIANRAREILSGAFSEMSVGSQIIQNSDFTIWARVVSAYAFGQGVHYFVWLKAIPEQELPFEHSVGFTTSFSLLRMDLGRKIIFTASLAALGLLLFSFFKNIPEARIIYLSLAAFHGYFEITALAFTKVKSI